MCHEYKDMDENEDEEEEEEEEYDTVWYYHSPFLSNIETQVATIGVV